MTTNQPNPITTSLGQVLQQVTEAFADLGFRLTAQAALGLLLTGNHDEARAKLTGLTSDQLEKINNSAHDLWILTGDILEDRETADEQTDETVTTEGNQP